MLLEASGTVTMTGVSLKSHKLRTWKVLLSVDGVYDLISLDGIAVPSPPNKAGVSITGGEVRLEEPLAGMPGWPTMLTGVIRFSGTLPHLSELPIFFTYKVGAHSPDPVSYLGGLGQPQPPVMLPPGLVINSNVAAGAFLPHATLADDHKTLTVVVSGNNLAVFSKRATTRTARLEPATRKLSFAATRQGSRSAPPSLTVFNTGSDPLRISSNVLFQGGAGSSENFAVTGGTCEHASFGTLAPGASCEVYVEFRPALTYRTGPRIETITLQTNAGSTSGFNLTGTTFELTGEAQDTHRWRSPSQRLRSTTPRPVS